MAGTDTSAGSRKVGTLKRCSSFWSPASMVMVCRGPPTWTMVRSARPMDSGSCPSMLTLTLSAQLNSFPSRVTALVSMSRVCPLPM
jgi:hypothetical protein